MQLDQAPDGADGVPVEGFVGSREGVRSARTTTGVNGLALAPTLLLLIPSASCQHEAVHRRRPQEEGVALIAPSLPLRAFGRFALLALFWGFFLPLVATPPLLLATATPTATTSTSARRISAVAIGVGREAKVQQIRRRRR